MRQVEVTEGPVHILRIAADQLTIIVGVKGRHILLYDAAILAKEV